MTTTEPTYTPAFLDPENVLLEFGPAPAEPSGITAAARDDTSDGAMIALVPTLHDLERLALAGFEAPNDLHLTLFYLGDADKITPTQINELVTGVIQQVRDEGGGTPILARAFGVAHWNPESEYPAWVLNVGDEKPVEDGDTSRERVTGLADVRHLVEHVLADLRIDYPPQHSPWQPHVCIAYSKDDLYGELASRLGPLTFDVLRVAWGEYDIDIPLVNKPTEPDENDDTQADSFSSDMLTTASSGGELVTAATTKPVDKNEDKSELAESCGEGFVKVGDGSCVTQEEFDRKSKWRGVLVVEGVTTGDGREFAPNALEWDENAFLRWQKEGAHGGQHDVTVSAGRIDRVWRDGNQVWGEGVIDLRSADGWELARRLDEGFAGGISIDADNIAQPDIEVVWPEAPDGEIRDEETNQLMMLFGQPEKVIFHGGRVRAATVVDIPAFVEARIALVSNEANIAPTVSVNESFSLPRHTTETVDSAWTTTERVGRDRPVWAYAWANDRVGMFLHHDVDGETVGAANLTACAAAIARLNEYRGIVPDADERAVYEHLAGHLRDAGLSPMPFKEADVVLASGAADVEWRPPALWFQDPGLTVPVGITVTDQGRVYGHAAQWGECHVGHADLCITPPVEDRHPYFMTGEVFTDDGQRRPVGQITVGTGHAPLSYQARRAAEHYDNTGAVVADVAVGNDSVGIWVAGAIRPNVEQSRVHALRAAGRVSGDWRRIGGELRLVGLLGVNVAGFPLHTRARVASGVPTSLVAAGFMSVGNVMSKEDHDNAALRHVMGMLKERVNKKD